mgnify:CR=1 FL=1
MAGARRAEYTPEGMMMLASPPRQEGIRCPACRRKVAEALTGTLTVRCPRCHTLFTVDIPPK